jgi:predicted site-specific integrase-resolvase
MNRYSTNEAAKLLGITGTSLVRYMKAGKIPMPEIIKAGRSTVHSWSEEEVEKLRQLLPKIANGRKTRYNKKHSAVSIQQSAKTKPKTRKPKKK